MTTVVPDSDHVSRYCRGGVIVGGELQGAAFILRQDEKGLSVNWLEHLGSGRATQLAVLRACLSKKLTIRPSARLAILNVRRLRMSVLEGTEGLVKLSVLHAPESDDPSHSEIHGITQDQGPLVAELLLQAVENPLQAAM